jgi:hypothetical protein
MMQNTRKSTWHSARKPGAPHSFLSIRRSAWAFIGYSDVVFGRTRHGGTFLCANGNKKGRVSPTFSKKFLEAS